MNPDFPVKISQGEIFVKAAHGRIEETNFILYLTVREKHPSAEVTCTGMFTHIRIFATPETIRPPGEGDDRHVPIREDEPSTLVELPGDWEVGVTAGRYTVCILGARTPSGDENQRIPFTEVTESHFQ